MLGFTGLMAVLMALISLGSYWISWDLEHKEYRPSFATKTWDDFVDLVRKCRGVFRGVITTGAAARAKTVTTFHPARQIFYQRLDPRPTPERRGPVSIDDFH